MSLLCWNCRRVGRLRTVLEIHRLVKTKKPRFLFLIETKAKIGKLERLRCSLVFEGLFHVDPIGRSGGLAFLWNNNKEVEIVSYSQRHVSALITLMNEGQSWTFTGFYGHPDRALSEESWKLLTHLRNNSSSAWMCIRDFNEIVNHQEKVGGAVRNEAQMEKFWDTLIGCNLGDLGYRGSKYTWWNKRDSVFVKERLDRAVATLDWCAKFPNSIVEVFPATTSDHSPLYVHFNSIIRVPPKIFRFEAKWNLDEQCSEVVREAWNRMDEGTSMLGMIGRNMDRCRRSLNSWSKVKFRAVESRISDLSKRLASLQRAECPGNLGDIQEVQEEINKLLEMEDLKWRQRAKRNWFAGGDRNTQFFHAWANQRRRTNFIGSIIDVAGQKWNTAEEVGAAFTGYFQELYTTDGVEGVADCTEVVTARVPPAQNDMLLAVFLADEIDQALAQMHTLKSPGPDGLGVCFFQHHWETIGPKVKGAILDFVNGGSFDPGIIKTFIALIPKSPEASLVGEYRPISLCNVVYKLIAKVLANRLKRVLPSI